MELDCGDDGAPWMASIQRAIEMIDFAVEKHQKAWLSSSQAPSGAHLSSETSTLKAMSAFQALLNWIAEMMAPPRWR
jgi:hypothetical protein